MDSKQIFRLIQTGNPNSPAAMVTPSFGPETLPEPWHSVTVSCLAALCRQGQ